jgi:hypothetical protein
VSRQRQAAVQAIRLRHHELVLRLDAQMERAVEAVRGEEGRRGKEGERGEAEARGVVERIEGCIQVIAQEINHRGGPEA